MFDEISRIENVIVLMAVFCTVSLYGCAHNYSGTRYFALELDTAGAEASLECRQQGGTDGDCQLESVNTNGMLFAYWIHQIHGMEGLRESLRCGPGQFIQLAESAAERLGERFPSSITAHSAYLDLCLAEPMDEQPVGMGRNGYGWEIESERRQ